MKIEDLLLWFEDDPDQWKVSVLRDRLRYLRVLLKREMLLCPVCGSPIKAVEYNTVGVLWCDVCEEWDIAKYAVLIGGEQNFRTICREEGIKPPKPKAVGTRLISIF